MDLPITIDKANDVNPMVVGNVVMKVDSLKYKVIQSAIAPSQSIPQKAMNDNVNRWGPKSKNDLFIPSADSLFFLKWSGNKFDKKKGIDKKFKPPTINKWLKLEIW